MTKKVHESLSEEFSRAFNRHCDRTSCCDCAFHVEPPYDDCLLYLVEIIVAKQEKEWKTTKR